MDLIQENRILCRSSDLRQWNRKLNNSHIKRNVLKNTYLKCLCKTVPSLNKLVKNLLMNINTAQIQDEYKTLGLLGKKIYLIAINKPLIDAIESLPKTIFNIYLLQTTLKFLILV